MKVKKGDQVKILSGKYRGKISDVVAVYPRTEKVLVKDVNIVSKFRKSSPNSEKKGGIVKIEMPIHSSNVMVINPESGKPSRIGYSVNKEGKKERIFKSNTKAGKKTITEKVEKISKVEPKKVTTKTKSVKKIKE
ncbi:50S ribosomal protein L24 [Candidatus Dojkabacteria bacterium]|nr:50S ribosomal protein L24 [Candidatus Dojkabacteria bacterium]